MIAASFELGACPRMASRSDLSRRLVNTIYETNINCNMLRGDDNPRKIPRGSERKGEVKRFKSYHELTSCSSRERVLI